MYGIYGNIYHQYTPNVSIYIYNTWILWVRCPFGTWSTSFRCLSGHALPPILSVKGHDTTIFAKPASPGIVWKIWWTFHGFKNFISIHFPHQNGHTLEMSSRISKTLIVIFHHFHDVHSFSTSNTCNTRQIFCIFLHPKFPNSFHGHIIQGHG